MKNRLISLFNIPNLRNKFYLIRSIRLAIAITSAIVFAKTFDFNFITSFSLYITTVLLGVSDMSTNLVTRVKMLLVNSLGLLITGISIIFIGDHLFWILLFIVLLVRITFNFSFRFPEKNLHFTVILLGFCFFLPLELNLYNIDSFVFGLVLGSVWYIVTLYFGYLTYLFFTRENKEDRANLFFVDSTNSKYGKTSFFANRETALLRRKLDLNSDRITIWSHPYRLAISMIIAFLIGFYLKLNNGYWIMMTVVLLHNPSQKISAGIPRILRRFSGTVIGLILYLPIAEMNLAIYWLYLLIFISAFFIFLSIRDNYFVAVIFITYMVLSSIKINFVLDNSILLERFSDTSIAILIVLFSHVVLLSARSLKLKSQRSFKSFRRS